MRRRLPTYEVGLSALSLRSVRSGCNLGAFGALAFPSVVCLADIFGRCRFWIVGHCYHGVIRQYLSGLERKRTSKNRRALSVRSPSNVFRIAGLLWSLSDRELFDLFRLSVVCVAASVGLQDLLRRTDSAISLPELRILR